MKNKEKNRSKVITPHKTRKDWLMVQLGDVCEFNPKKSEIKHLPQNYCVSFVPMADLNIKSINFKIKQEKKLNEVYSGYTYFSENDVLFARVTPSFENGKAGIAKNLKNRIGFGSSEFFVYRANPKKILPEMIYYFISDNQFINNGKNHMTGTGGLQRLTKDYAIKYKIPLAPLPEQKAIVRKIESVFKLVDSSEKELKSAKEKLKVYRQAVLKKAFDGKLLSKKELDICKKKKGWKPVNKLLNDINLKATTSPHKIRKDWLMVQLGDVSHLYQPKTITKKEMIENGKYPVFGANGIIGRYNQYNHKNSEVLITCRGATCGTINISKPKSWVTGNAMVIKPLKNNINKNYLFYLLNKPDFSSVISGTAQPQITRQNLLPFKISLPPLEEQKAIVQKIENIFSHCDKLSSEIEQNLKNIMLLRQSVLKKAFSGTFLNKRELETCKKSPQWKSAKSLLEEIQKEQKKPKNNLKPKKKKEESPMNKERVVSKVWNFCNVLRDDGVSYTDYIEQMTFLLFLKMADEYSKAPHYRKIGIPPKYTWDKLVRLKGRELEDHYSDTLKKLGSLTGMIGRIFVKAQNRIQDPAKLSKLISMIDGENWVIMGVDTKGDIYEGLLEKNAEDTKSGAGQYFTPRALIKTMVECIRPEPKKTIGDPACGTGGFFLASYDFLVGNYKLDRSQKDFLKKRTFKGNEIVASTRRLCLMNLFLHNIGEMTQEQEIISSNDSLKADSGDRFDYVLANPPFGKTSSITITNEKGEQKKEITTYNRQDFWVTTSNKQLNFVQHIKSILKSTGKCAVVLPDNVLFEAGVGETVRRKLLETTNLHTILRLPTGIFYKQGVRANVLFFDNKVASKEVQTKEIWFYDYRTNIKHTLKDRPLKPEHLKDFIKCYNPKNPNKRTETWSKKNPSGRWRKYTYKEIAKKDKYSLDIFWLKEASSNLDNLPEPKELAKDISQSLQTANQNFKEVLKHL